MAYTKTNWQDRQVEKPLTFTMSNNPDGTVTLTPAEGTVVNPGTPLSANNLNKLETQYQEAFNEATNWAQSFGLGGNAKRLSSTDLNHLDVSGLYSISGTTINSPLATAGTWGYVIHIKFDDNNRKQMVFDFGSEYSYTRRQQNGIWYPWSRIIEVGSDGIASVGRLITSSNGTGDNIVIGDDAYIGDVNFQDSIGIKGKNNGNVGFIRFGESPYRFGWDGAYLNFGGSFILGGDVLTNRISGKDNVNKLFFGDWRNPFGWIDSTNNAVRFQFNDDNYLLTNGAGVAFYHGGRGVGRFSIGDNGTTHTFLQGQSSGIQFLGNNGGIQARTYDNANYIPMYASAFTPNSVREAKKNIVPFVENAVELIENTPVYNYQYKNELEGELPHTGIILDEAPVWAADPLGEGVDLYAMVSMSWKAIQELSAKNKELEARISVLEANEPLTE